MLVARSISKRRARGVEFAQILRGKRRGFCENFLEFRPATRKFNACACKNAARKAHDAGAAFGRVGDAFAAENHALSALKMCKIFAKPRGFDAKFLRLSGAAHAKISAACSARVARRLQSVRRCLLRVRYRKGARAASTSRKFCVENAADFVKIFWNFGPRRANLTRALVSMQRAKRTTPARPSVESATRLLQKIARVRR